MTATRQAPVSIRAFVDALCRKTPHFISYNQALGLADRGILPTWPRWGREPYRIRLDETLLKFLISSGLTPQAAESLMVELTR